MTRMNFKLFLINVCTIVSDSYYTITGKIKNVMIGNIWLGMIIIVTFVCAIDF